MRAQAVLQAARDYLREHPEELGRAARSALGLRFGVPVVALRWLGRQLEETGKVSDLKIDAVPPGIKVQANVDLMSTPLRASAVVYIERIRLTEQEMSFTVRLEEVSLKLNGDAQTPVAALIKSGALDVSKPGNLAAHLPDLPPVIVEAKDNRLAIDLMRDPKLASNPLVQRFVGVLTSFVTVHRVETDDDHLDVAFRALPSGVRGPVSAVRRHMVLPALGRLLPRG
jgi:hypothetical protein